MHATAAIKCHPSLFLLASALHPEQAFEVDGNDLLGMSQGSYFGWRSSTQLTTLHFAASSEASGETEKLIVNQLLSMNPDEAQAVDSEGSLPLHRIIKNKDKTHWALDRAKYLYMAPILMQHMLQI